MYKLEGQCILVLLTRGNTKTTDLEIAEAAIKPRVAALVPRLMYPGT